MNREAAILTDAQTRDLIEQTGLGNERAFEQLCRVYEKPLFRVAFNVLGHPDVAHEVTQDVLLAIWQSSKNFRGDCKAFSWMFAIARHKAISALRSSLNSTVRTDTGDADIFREKPEVDVVISEALKTLSPEHRLVVILSYYLHLSHAHVGELMHCPVGTVKSRLSNALKQLREVWATPVRLHSFSQSAT